MVEKNDEWFYLLSSERLGPVSSDTLKAKLFDGELTDKTLIWTHSFGDEWKSIGAVFSRNIEVPTLQIIVDKRPIEVEQKKDKDENWFNQAAKVAILNGLWLGPLNIFLWFQWGRFDTLYYQFLAGSEEYAYDEIGVVIFYEMLLMLLSLFVVHSLFIVAKVKPSGFTWLIFFVLATLMWSGLSLAFGLQ